MIIRETSIDKSLNHLSEHFGPHVVVRPPASMAEVAELEALVGPLPRDFILFLSTCDGLRVDVEAPDDQTHLWHCTEIKARVVSGGYPVPAGFLPVRGDPTGECDYLVLLPGPIHGAVVRWNLWVEGAELMATSFGRYLDCWVRYLTERFDENGRKRGAEPVIAFDERFAGCNDPDLSVLRESADVCTCLHMLDSAVASGADFE
jgi:hypothetical protein